MMRLLAMLDPPYANLCPEFSNDDIVSAVVAYSGVSGRISECDSQSYVLWLVDLFIVVIAYPKVLRGISSS